MKIAYTAVALCTLAFSAHAQHVGVVHYEIEPPVNNEAALVLLQAHTDAVGAIIVNATLSDAQLEKIHEHTYSMEAAVDKLRESDEDGVRETTLDTADEAVQALHFASENHKESEVRQWFATLKPSVDMVESAYQPESATPSAIEE